jgi:signal transduction histidine kinase
MGPKGFVRLPQEEAVAELNHQINSPLAAIRNALYLIACRCSEDPEVRRYLRLADEEVGSIAEILQAARYRSVCATHGLEQRARAASAGRRGMV